MPGVVGVLEADTPFPELLVSPPIRCSRPLSYTRHNLITSGALICTPCPDAFLVERLVARLPSLVVDRCASAAGSVMAHLQLHGAAASHLDGS